MAEWRYHFYDLPSGELLDTLPMEQVAFGVEMRGVGTLTGSVPLYADDVDARRVLAATIPHRTKVFVERDNALVWGGRVVPPRDYSSSEGRLTINAEETLGVFAHRFLPDLTWSNTDQFDIFRGLVAALQAEPGGDMGLTVSPNLSGVRRDHSYLRSDHTVGLTALVNLSELINGFDFATSVSWDEHGRPKETIVLAYPLMGRFGSQTGLSMEYVRGSDSGGIASYSWSDGEGLFTRSWATTETEEGVTMIASTTNHALIAQGYPLLEQRQSYDGIVNLETLQAHADALTIFSAGHRVTAEVTVRARPGLELGDWQMGDQALVRLTDYRFPAQPGTGAPGFHGYMRIVGWRVTPGPPGRESYTFTMADFLEAL